jgi:hypothetical protein
LQDHCKAPAEPSTEKSLKNSGLKYMSQIDVDILKRSGLFSEQSELESEGTRILKNCNNCSLNIHLKNKNRSMLARQRVRILSCENVSIWWHLVIHIKWRYSFQIRNNRYVNPFVFYVIRNRVWLLYPWWRQLSVGLHAIGSLNQQESYSTSRFFNGIT